MARTFPVKLLRTICELGKLDDGSDCKSRMKKVLSTCDIRSHRTTFDFACGERRMHITCSHEVGRA